MVAQTQPMMTMRIETCPRGVSPIVPACANVSIFGGEQASGELASRGLTASTRLRSYRA